MLFPRCLLAASCFVFRFQKGIVGPATFRTDLDLSSIPFWKFAIFVGRSERREFQPYLLDLLGIFHRVLCDGDLGSRCRCAQRWLHVRSKDADLGVLVRGAIIRRCEVLPASVRALAA